MDKENTQKELFEFDQPRAQPKRFGQLFQKADFAFSLGAEKLVFVSIGILMLLVVSFALGVERGKAVSAVVSIEKVAAAAKPVAQPRAQVSVAPAQQAAQVKTPPVARSIPATAPAQLMVDKSKPYTIVAAAFSKEASAVAEVNKMKAGGMDAFVYRSEPFYLACVGAFTNKDSAQRALVKVKQMHRDAYVKLK